MCAASVYQMMRGFLVVMTAGLATIFLKRKQYIHHVMSIVMIVVGIIIVGEVNIRYSQDQKDEHKNYVTTSGIGVVLLLIGQSFFAT